MNIVMNTNKRDIIVQLIEFMVERYYQIVNMNQANTQFLIEQVLSVLHTAILAHKNAVPNNDILSSVCGLVNFHINRNGIEAESLSLLGALVTTFGKQFESRANNYWT